MTDYPSLLNETQLDAVTTNSQYVRIIAGAGSGKTRVLTYRIAYLIEKMGVDPISILAVTFTNKAANEMRERVIQIVPEAMSFLSVSTFHSFCARFLRKEAYLIGYPRSFAILDDEDRMKLIKEVAAAKGYKKSDPIVALANKFIDVCKNEGKYPQDIVITHENFFGHKTCLEIYQAYEEKKEAMYALDFDDLLLKTLDVLVNYDEVRNAWANRFKHILVDEFQDTNDVQFKLIRLLMNEDTCLYVVGDPDQTIYTWRGANQKIILDFPIVFENTIDIILNRNYRSTKNILDGANSLISYNKNRVKKDLFTLEEEGSQIEARSFSDSLEEAKWVVSKISYLLKKGEEYQQIAILYRNNAISREFEKELTRNQIPYKLFGGLRFYQRREVKDALAYFKLMLNPKDDISFERIINVPRRSIGLKSIEIIQEASRELKKSEYEICEDIARGADIGLKESVNSSIRDLVSRIDRCKKDLEDGSEGYSGILRGFLVGIDYFKYLAEEQEIDEDRVGNVNALFDDINQYIKENPQSTFDEYLQNISLLTSQDDMDGGKYISLMTIHVAKGLEFKNVFIVGMNEGIFPSIRSLTELGNKGLEEERRLAYVAMTRAKYNLFMTSNSSYSYQTDSHSSPSSFFREAKLTVIPNDNMFKKSQNTLNFYQSPRKTFSEEKTFSRSTVEDKPKSNGISDWKIGDRVNHVKFGEGVVREVVNEELIKVYFNTAGEKLMVSSHPSLSRICSKGGEA